MMSRCPNCVEPVVLGASFCEACGAGLAKPPQDPEAQTPVPDPDQQQTQIVCVSCGDEVGVGSDGYCPVCGHRQPEARDHIEIDHRFIAGVTDLGKRHHHNEDAMAFDVTTAGFAVVVCDGVSTTENSAEASQAAADAALAVLASVQTADPTEILVDAAKAARAAVARVPAGPSGSGNPSCTFVAALVVDNVLSVGWLGDSRAYWLGSEARLLTHDHTWANEMVASGAMAMDEALQQRQAASITRWLGVDAPDVEPSVVTFEVGSGQLVVCSDGLWNYAETAEALASNPALAKPTPLARAQSLVEFALQSGGHDNVTVVVAEVGNADVSSQADVVTEAQPGPNVADTPGG